MTRALERITQTVSNIMKNKFLLLAIVTLGIGTQAGYCAQVGNFSLSEDGTGINFPYEYESIGLNLPPWGNFRLHSQGHLVFHTGPSLIERMVISPDGNVGIGTSNPQRLLQVGDANLPNSQGLIRLASRTGTGHDALREWDFGVPETDDDVSGAGYSFVIDDIASGAGPEFMIKYGSGNVGIGTTSPTYKLHVAGRVYVASGIESANGLLLRGNSIETPEIGSDDSEVAVNYAGYNSGYTRYRNFHVYNGRGGSALLVRGSDGNVGIGTTSPQAKLDVAGTINCQTITLTSDRNMKAGLTPVDRGATLEQITKLPISIWHYTNSPAVRHIGPMAQDFQAAFGVGEDDKHISVVDGLGVVLAAIQGLHQQVKEKDAAIAVLKQEMSALKQDFAARFEKMEKMMVAADVSPRTSVGLAPTHVGGYESSTDAR